MKKFFAFVILIGLIGGGVFWGYSVWKQKNKPLKTPYTSNVKKKNEETYEPLRLGNTYIQMGENLAFSLSISDYDDKTIDGILETAFIEDTFAKTTLVNKKWIVKGIQNEKEKWDFYIKENQYDQEQVTGTVSKNEIIFDSIPFLDSPKLTLQNDDGFSIDTFKTQLTKTNQNLMQSRKKNIFSDFKTDEMSAKLEEQLKLYPKNTDNSLSTTGITKMNIHTAYLQELTNRLNQNFTKTSQSLTSISNYLKKKNIKNDPHFKDNVQNQFNELLAINDEGQKIFSLYEPVIDFYEIPNEERSKSFDLDDENTSKALTKLLQTYSSSAINKYSAKLSGFEKQTDTLFMQFNKQMKTK